MKLCQRHATAVFGFPGIGLGRAAIMSGDVAIGFPNDVVGIIHRRVGNAITIVGIITKDVGSANLNDGVRHAAFPCNQPHVGF